ncbi:hypothetical protein TNCV_2738101 [Trichonephila clavipes]|nr:hypothetical protein TNCV_2738101 [Trichonephila clavipes]
MRIHWCAKIKDEVETLAYQLNEEAERTERPIRRLTVKITPSCCLSEKWRIIKSVRRHLDAFTRGRIIGKLEEGRSVTNDGTLSYKPEETGGRQREKSLDTRHRRLDDRYRVLPWPEDCTVVVCLHDALYGVPLTPAHRRRRSLWCREHRNRRDNEWG